MGKPDQARPHYEQALEIARKIRTPLEEARALKGLARCATATDDPQSALTLSRRATEIYAQTGAAEDDQL
jgi:tetratricopeptide (TPR) repeat protein